MSLAFTDASGQSWEVIDFKAEIGRKQRVPLCNWRAEARAFVPVGREGNVMIYAFGAAPARWSDARTLNDQLHFAKPVGSSPGERLNGG
jgi:hypothetical protein